MTEVYRSLGSLKSRMAALPWPVDFFSPDDLPAFLDKIHIVDHEMRGGINGAYAAVVLAVLEELSVALPGVDGVRLVFGGGVEGVTILEVAARFGERNEVTFRRIRFSLRFDPSVLTPAPDDEGVVASHAEIICEGRLTIDDGFDVQLGGFDSLRLRPVMIGSSGIILSAEGVKLDLSRTSSPPEVLAAGFDESFLGVFIGEAKVRFPDGFPSLAPEDLVLRNCAIGSGGVSGTLAATYSPVFDEASGTFTGRGAGELFGVAFGLREVDLALRANAFERARMSGDLLLPFFDAPVAVDLGLTLGGGLVVNLSSETGLTTIRKEGVLEIELESLGFDVTGAGLAVRLSGTLRPLIGGLDWPAFEVKELFIDSDGNVRLDGGWLELPEQYRLDFHGFGIDITKIGFGRTDDGGRWVGFSGGISLAASVRAGASVEGLRVTWYADGRDPDITLEGVGVELAIPDVLAFQGRVAYRQLVVDGALTHRFDGAIRLVLLALDLTIDGQLVIGKNPAGTTFLAIHLGTELPAGIPLWSTGLALYGIEGLFALHMEPGRAPDQEWYEGWYKAPTVGATDLRKWTDREGSMAVGAGVTLGTVADNGFTFNAKTLLVIVLPGPIVMIEGKANILRERATLAGEPTFRALAVIDKRSDTFEVGLDAQYRQPAGGELIDIRGSAEAYFSLSDAAAWHLYLGEMEPREKRIRAHVLSLVEANSYFMLDAERLQMGAWAGWAKRWKFGPLRVVLEAWIEGDAVVSWRPVHFHGEVAVHGKAELKVFGFGVSLSVDARIAADVFDPFHLLGEFSVGIGLPWPLPDFDVDISLEWGPTPTWPPLPEPLKEIAVEHFKSTATWPVAIGGDLGAPPADAPVVPLDARPHLTFSRPVHDDALAGVNGREVTPAEERIGDPAANQGPVRVRYGLREVTLERWRGGAWQRVARSVGPTHPQPNPAGLPRLYGSWAPVPAMPDLDGAAVAQVKLWLWSKTPFDWTRNTGAEWDEWFTEHADDYPCVDIPEDELVCWGLDGTTVGEQVTRPWVHPDEPELQIFWRLPAELTVSSVRNAEDVAFNALCIPSVAVMPGTRRRIQNLFAIVVPVPNIGVQISVRCLEGAFAFAFDAQFQPVANAVGGQPPAQEVVLAGENIRYVFLVPRSPACLYGVCIRRGLSKEERDEREEMAAHVLAELARWSQADNVLEPDTAYRLRTVTTVEATGEGELSGTQDSEQVQFVHFRTEGPPGLVALSTPAGHPPGEPFVSGLEDLVRYVRQTLPPTVIGPGELPALPRPVYRAYDVGLAFNENYVDLMYRLARRDLGLYLFDANDRPARAPDGGLLVPAYGWDRTADVALDETEAWWVTVVNQSTCASLETETILHDSAMRAAGHVLDGDTLYQARLVPLLLHDDFAALPLGTTASGTGASLDGWTVVDGGGSGGASRWTIVEVGAPPSRALAQTGGTWGGSAGAADVRRPGTLLRRGGAWTDYRVTLHARSSAGESIGVAVRVVSNTEYYLFALDRRGRGRRLVRVFHDEWTVLAADDVVHAIDRDYFIAVEAVGETITVHVDGERIFEVADGAFAAGGIGLYCWRDGGARFTDVRVDDLARAAPSVFRWSFTTSRFADFHHQLHSFADELDVSGLSAAAAAALAGAALQADPPSEDELRGHDTVAMEVLGASARRQPTATRVTALAAGDGEVAALLVEHPEPVDARRATYALARHPRTLPASSAPGPVKLTAAAFADLVPAGESATLLLQDAAALADLRVERLALPGPLDTDRRAPLLDFRPGAVRAGVLFDETFGDAALDAYTILDEGTNTAPSRWRVIAGSIAQESNIWGGDTSATTPRKPGTLALVGDAAWSDVRVTAVLRSEDDDALGVVFRCDGTRGYRFSMDRQRAYRRLVRFDGDDAAVLWEDGVAYQQGQAYRVVIEAHGDVLLGWVDDMLVFHVRDAAIAAGRVGLYCWANQRAFFDGLRVESLERAPVVFAPQADSLDGWSVVDVGGLASSWAVDAGGIAQTSPVPTFLLGGPARDDVAVAVSLDASATGAVGVAFRFRAVEDHYRFELDTPAGRRRLVRRAGDVASVLWEDAVAPIAGQRYELTVRAAGAELSGHVGGALVFRVYDRAIADGVVALYVAGATDARFARVVVTDATRWVERWQIVDEGTTDRPSDWRLGRGALVQRARIRGGLETAPEKPGTYAVAGDPAWTDVRFEARLRSDEDGALGVVFRWVDASNHYRMSFDRLHGERRLVKVAGGVVTVLWAAGGSFPPGRTFALAIDAVGPRLVGRVDGATIFDVRDATHPAGRCGLYAWANGGARFERVVVRPAPLDAYVLFADRFAADSLAGWTIVDDGTTSGPSAWTASDGTVRQTRNIHDGNVDPAVLAKRGTQLVAGDAAWTDVAVSVRLASHDDDAIGLVFRRLADDRYYRFSMDRERAYRRLVKNVGGVFTVLWQDKTPYELGRAMELTVVARGDRLQGFADGVPMFDVQDGDIAAGRIGLYCWGNVDARFAQVRVYEIAGAAVTWDLDERVASPYPPRATTAADGTYTLGGDAAWGDYRVVARVSIDGPGSLGVVGRFSDTGDHYRLAIDRTAGTRRLTVKQGADVRVLWEENGSLPPGTEHVLALDCVGTRLRGWLGGTALFAVDDATLARGRAGVYSNDPTTRIAGLRIGRARWHGYADFDDASVRAAGTQVTFSGGDHALFIDEDVALRIVAAGAPSPRMLHERRFVRAIELSHVPVRVLRKRDHTGVVLVPDGGPLPSGHHQLFVVYARSGVPDLPDLARNGDDAPEVATIDLFPRRS